MIHDPIIYIIAHGTLDFESFYSFSFWINTVISGLEATAL